MITAKFGNTTLEVPESLHELKLKDYVNFMVNQENLTLHTEDKTVKLTNDKYLYLLCKCVGAFYGKNLVEIFELPIDLDFNGTEDEKLIDKKQLNISLHTLYYHAIDLITKLYDTELYTYKDTFVIYQGTKYEIPNVLRTDFKVDTPTKIKTGDAIDLLMLNKALTNNNNSLKKASNDLKGVNAIVKQRYLNYLKMVAILYSPVGAKLPKTSREFEGFVTDKMRKLENIDVYNSFRIIFFLKNILKMQVKTLSLGTSLNRQNPQLNKVKKSSSE